MLFIEVIPTVLQATDLGHTTGCTICRQDATKVHRDIKQFVKVDQYMTFGQRVPRRCWSICDGFDPKWGWQNTHVLAISREVFPLLQQQSRLKKTAIAHQHLVKHRSGPPALPWQAHFSEGKTLRILCGKIQFLLGQLNKVNKVNKDHITNEKVETMKILQTNITLNVALDSFVALTSQARRLRPTS